MLTDKKQNCNIKHDHTYIQYMSLCMYTHTQTGRKYVKYLQWLSLVWLNNIGLPNLQTNNLK